MESTNFENQQNPENYQIISREQFDNDKLKIEYEIKCLKNTVIDNNLAFRQVEQDRHLYGLITGPTPFNKRFIKGSEEDRINNNCHSIHELQQSKLQKERNICMILNNRLFSILQILKKLDEKIRKILADKKAEFQVENLGIEISQLRKALQALEDDQDLKCIQQEFYSKDEEQLYTDLKTNMRILNSENSRTHDNQIMKLEEEIKQYYDQYPKNEREKRKLQ